MNILARAVQSVRDYLGSWGAGATGVEKRRWIQDRLAW